MEELKYLEEQQVSPGLLREVFFFFLPLLGRKAIMFL